MGLFSGKKIRWNHFGKKYNLRLSEYEWDYSDIYDALLKKIHEQRHDFEGTLAYIDGYGRQAIIRDDKSLRDALTESKGKLKLHTTLPENAVISAADIAGRPARSQSVPPSSAPPPPGYYKVTTYPTMYSQNLLYGMPPHNGMLWRFLASPFPFGHGKTWMGPNKYHSFGNYHGFYPGYGGGRYMHSSSWGPIF
ncbi:unnamed protein product, partial [Mesorhabditis spiculigera]